MMNVNDESNGEGGKDGGICISGMDIDQYTPARRMNSNAGKSTATKFATQIYATGRQVAEGGWGIILTAQQVCDWIKKKCGVDLKPEAIRRLHREGRVGMTPGKRQRTSEIPIAESGNQDLMDDGSPSTGDESSLSIPPAKRQATSPLVLADKFEEINCEQQPRLCSGISSGRSGKIRGFVVNKLRATALAIEDIDDDNDDYLEGFRSVEEIKPKDSKDGNGITVSVEGGNFVVRATDCVKVCRSTTSGQLATRCDACNQQRDGVSSQIAKVVPFNKRNTPLAINARANIRYIATNPKMALQSIKQERMEKAKLRKEVHLLRLQIEMSKAVQVTNKTKVKVIISALEEAEKKVDDAFNKGDKDEEPRHMFHCFYQHFVKNGKCFLDGNKSSGIRFPPMILQFAMLVLSKTSHSVYKMIGNVLMLPSLSYVLRKQKELVGDQCELNRPYGIMVEATREVSKQMTQDGHTTKGARMGGLSFDSMNQKQGIGYDLHNDFSGLDPYTRFDVVEREFRAMAKAQNEADDPETATAENTTAFLDRSDNLAKHHLIFKWSSTSPGVDTTFTVAALNVSEMKPSMLMNVLHAVIVELCIAGLGVCSVAADGASENCKLFAFLATLNMNSLLTQEVREKFNDIDFDFCAAMIHPITDEPIFILEDMPHVVKRVVNALERSSNPNEMRDLKWNKSPLNLKMIKTAWEATGGKEYHLAETKLTARHFHKDANSRMIVSLAVQVLSTSSANMMDAAMQDENVDLKMHKSMYEPLIQLARHIDDLVDIVNGRSRTKNVFTANFDRMASVAIRDKLLGILSWFSKWHLSVENNDNSVPANFLADQTWTGLRRLIFGYIGILEHHVQKNGFTIMPRRTTSDPCENHFAQLRSSGGCSANGMAKDNNALTAKSNLTNVVSAQFLASQKSNNAQAPPADPFKRRDRF